MVSGHFYCWVAGSFNLTPNIDIKNVRPHTASAVFPQLYNAQYISLIDTSGANVSRR